MRFIADSSDYYDYLKEINILTDSQKKVLYERLKSELPMTQSTPIQSLSLPTTATTTIRTALPDSDKPTYTFHLLTLPKISMYELRPHGYVE